MSTSSEAQQDLQNLKTFVTKHRLNKDDEGIFNFTIMNPSTERGRIFIPKNEIDEFFQLYCDALSSASPGKAVMCMTEIDVEYSMLRLDFDGELLCPENKAFEIFSKEEILRVIKSVNERLEKRFSLKGEKEFRCCILSKDPRTENGKCKHGYHLVWHHLFLEKKVRKSLIEFIYGTFREEFQNKNIKGDSVIDRGILNHPWLLYGSGKDIGVKTFQLREIVDKNLQSLKLEDCIRESGIRLSKDGEEIDVEEKLETYYIPIMLSIIPRGRPLPKVNDIFTASISGNFIQNIKEEENENDERKEYDADIKDVVENFITNECDGCYKIERWNGPFLQLVRTKPHLCPINLERTHDRQNAYITVDNKGNIFFGCYCGAKMENNRNRHIGRYREFEVENPTIHETNTISTEEIEEESSESEDEKNDSREEDAYSIIGSQRTELIFEEHCYTWMNFMSDFHNHVFKSKDELAEKVIPAFNKVVKRIENIDAYLIKYKPNEDWRLVKSINRHPLTFIYKYQTTINGENKTIKKQMSVKQFIREYLTYLELYSSIVFKPNNHNCIYGEFNKWQGFKANEVEKVEMSRIQPILQHIREVLASDNEGYYNYILSWLSAIIREPYKKTGVALVLQSTTQGVGKTIITDFLRDYIFGTSISKECANGIDSLTGRFNSELEGKLLVVSTEMSSTADAFRKNFDIMKNLITDSRITIEPKGVDKYEVDNPSNYIFCTNHSHTIHVERSDRRYAMFECTPKYVGNRAYFNNLLKFTKDQDTANHFFTYLLKEFKIQNDIRDIPYTKLKESMIDQSLPSPLKFLKDIRESETKNIKDWICIDLLRPNNDKVDCDRPKASDLYNAYKRWCDSTREKSLSQIQFGSVIKDYINKGKKGSEKIVTYDISSIRKDL